MDVNINAYCGFVEGDCNNQVCDLPADSWKLDKFVNGIRDPAAKQFVQHEGQLFQVLCLCMVKTYGEDQLLDLRDGQSIEIGGPLDHLEQAVADLRRGLVFCSCAQYGRDEDHEGILGLALDELDNRRLVLVVLFPEQAVDNRYVGNLHFAPGTLYPLRDASSMVEEILQGVVFDVGWNGMIRMQNISATCLKNRNDLAVQLVINLFPVV